MHEHSHTRGAATGVAHGFAIAGRELLLLALGAEEIREGYTGLQAFGMNLLNISAGAARAARTIQNARMTVDVVKSVKRLIYDDPTSISDWLEVGLAAAPFALRVASMSGPKTLYYHTDETIYADFVDARLKAGKIGNPFLHLKPGAANRFWATSIEDPADLGLGAWRIGGRVNFPDTNWNELASDYPNPLVRMLHVAKPIRKDLSVTIQLSPNEAKLFRPALGTAFDPDLIYSWKGLVGQYHYNPARADLPANVGSVIRNWHNWVLVGAAAGLVGAGAWFRRLRDEEKQAGH